MSLKHIYFALLIQIIKSCIYIIKVNIVFQVNYVAENELGKRNNSFFFVGIFWTAIFNRQKHVGSFSSIGLHNVRTMPKSKRDKKGMFLCHLSSRLSVYIV